MYHRLRSPLMELLFDWDFPPMVFRWCHDIGREQAANKPLLKTVFQVNSSLFGSLQVIDSSIV